MKFFAMDLHIHSSLSPCGSEEMTPPNIIRKAKAVGLDALVIADHNSALNQEAFIECGRRMGLKILPGMEVQSREDVHVLCIFDSLEQVLLWQEKVKNKLPKIENNKDIFGCQHVVDWQGRVIGENNQLLLTSTSISVDEIQKEVLELGGLALPAHIDRPAFSLWGQLGFLSGEFNFLGVELTPHLKRKREQIDFIENKGLGVIISSDAHYLSQINGPYTWGYMEDFTIKELMLALKKEQGRYLVHSKETNPFQGR